MAAARSCTTNGACDQHRPRGGELQCRAEFGLTDERPTGGQYRGVDIEQHELDNFHDNHRGPHDNQSHHDEQYEHVDNQHVFLDEFDNEQHLLHHHFDDEHHVAHHEHRRPEHDHTACRRGVRLQ